MRTSGPNDGCRRLSCQCGNPVRWPSHYVYPRRWMLGRHYRDQHRCRAPYLLPYRPLLFMLFLRLPRLTLCGCTAVSIHLPKPTRTLLVSMLEKTPTFPWLGPLSNDDYASPEEAPGSSRGICTVCIAICVFTNRHVMRNAGVNRIHSGLSWVDHRDRDY